MIPGLTWLELGRWTLERGALREQVAPLLELAGVLILGYWYISTEVAVGGAKGLHLLANAHLVQLSLWSRIVLVLALYHLNALYAHQTLALGLHHLR